MNFLEPGEISANVGKTIYPTYSFSHLKRSASGSVPRFVDSHKLKRDINLLIVATFLDYDSGNFLIEIIFNHTCEIQYRNYQYEVKLK